MSKQAYRSIEDKNNHIIVKAKDCVANDLENVFFCIDPYCNAHLSLCSINSNKRDAYFAAKDKNYPHRENCPYSNSGLLISKNFNFEDFSLSSFFSRIAIDLKSENNKNKPINHSKHNSSSNKNSLLTVKTLRQLYNICLELSFDEFIGDTTVLNLLCNDATSFYYTKFINGIKIIVINIDYFWKKEEMLVAHYPPIHPEWNLYIKFSSSKLFFEVKNKFDNYNGNVLLFGNFKTTNSINKNVRCILTSIKQIIPISH